VIDSSFKNHPDVKPAMLLNALTVDVEDYYHVSGFERHIARDRWDDYPSRVVANTQRLLDLFARYSVRATFFVLGWVAERFPQLVSQIQAAGHEIGSHSFWHRLVYEQTPTEFRDDLVRSRRVLEEATGLAVTAYRAPSFSITRRSLWALEILAEEGFEIDSSIFPIFHDRYGIPNAEMHPHELQTPAGSLWEFPASVQRIAGVNLPVSGGGYFRLYPVWLTQRLLQRINGQQQPFMFYVHPWEIDSAQPRLRAGSVMGRMRHYLNLETTQDKLETLLKEFRFGTVSQSIAAVRNAPQLGAAV
jgi:polysaccharide deacetylase family protein (PEP-CTERM system associated)